MQSYQEKQPVTKIGHLMIETSRAANKHLWWCQVFLGVCHDAFQLTNGLVHHFSTEMLLTKTLWFYVKCDVR
jgi:hypothetical protein